MVVGVFVPASAWAGVKATPIGTFNAPTYIAAPPGDTQRLFVVQQSGQIELIDGRKTTQFLDISSKVTFSGEQGLLSMAFAPDYAASHRFYVYYTDRNCDAMGGCDEHVSEFTAESDDSALAAPEHVLITIPHPSESNHNGGQLQFGPEGDLYISTGDGGGSNDQHHNAQNLNSLLGKILRIVPRPGGGLPYSVPAGNPFAFAAPPADTIWSYGLRNPFRFSFDRQNGAMTIGDVGQDTREEVDYAPAPGLGAGADYGWNCFEGTEAGPATDPECSPPPLAGFAPPVFDYPHTDSGVGIARCAIIGGYVVRDAGLGALYGRYLYGDYCSGEIRSLDLSDPFGSDRSEGLQVANLNSFGEDSCGRLYAVSGSGAVERLVGATPASCQVPETSNLRPAFVGLRAARRRVERHRKVQITAWVSPCEGRRGEKVRLLRKGVPIGARRLSVACTAQFLPRIARPTAFKATIAEDKAYQAATSRPLRIKIQRHRRRAR
jgi:glucose/arabinose dehydrogenase